MRKRMLGSLFAIGLLCLAGSSISYAAENPAEQQLTLYERLGGEAGIMAVVDEFVALGAANPKVNFTRKGTDKEWPATPENVDKLKEHLIQFISVATGATDVIYEGRDMLTVHEGMKISNAEFDALALDLKAALGKFNVPDEEQNELLNIVGSIRGQIVEET